jgi:hypothetical protein
MIFGIVLVMAGLYSLGYFIFGSPREGLGSLFIFAVVPLGLGIWSIIRSVRRRRY